MLVRAKRFSIQLTNRTYWTTKIYLPFEGFCPSLSSSRKWLTAANPPLMTSIITMAPIIITFKGRLAPITSCPFTIGTATLLSQHREHFFKLGGGSEYGFPRRFDRDSSNPMWPFLTKKDTKRSHSCKSFSVEFFVSEKNVYHLHTIKIVDISKNVNKVNPIPVTAVQRFGLFQN